MRFRVLLLALAALAVVNVACSGEETTVVQTTSGTSAGISVNGTGRVFGAPDVVLLQLGVRVERPTVAAARDQAALSMQSVIDSLRANGVADKDIQNTRFSVAPQYDFTPDRVQTIRGYQVNNVVSAKVRKVDTAGKVIDDAARAGGNDVVVQSINFTIDDPTALREQARRLAVADARTRAEALAGHSNVGLGKVLAIVEGSASTPPEPYLVPALRAPQTGADVASPIAVGELEVAITVNVLYAIE
jgi:uncharacterized protein YggE